MTIGIEKARQLSVKSANKSFIIYLCTFTILAHFVWGIVKRWVPPEFSMSFVAILRQTGIIQPKKLNICFVSQARIDITSHRFLHELR